MLIKRFLSGTGLQLVTTNLDKSNLSTYNLGICLEQWKSDISTDGESEESLDANDCSSWILEGSDSSGIDNAEYTFREESEEEEDVEEELLSLRGKSSHKSVDSTIIDFRLTRMNNQMICLFGRDDRTTFHPPK